MLKLAIVTTHPIQYYAPLFREMAALKGWEVKVFYTLGKSQNLLYDPGFQKAFAWDIPLLDGYDYSFVHNYAKVPTTSGFWGIKNSNLYTEIKNWGAQAVLVFGWAYHAHLKLIQACKKNNIPVYFRGDSHLLDVEAAPLYQKWVRKWFLKWVYNHITAAFYVGQANKAYFLAYGLKNHQLVYAPHAIENERFSKAEHAVFTQINDWKQKFNILPHEKVVLFAGKFEPKKNPMFLVENFTKASLPYTHLILVGNGKLENPLHKLASNHKNIHFLPFQNQSLMPAVYGLCDVFCLPSQGPGETWGLAVNEAMACGKAVLVSNKCGCAQDVVLNGQNGYVFTSGNENEFIEKLTICLENSVAFGSISGVHIQNFTLKAVAKIIHHTIVLQK